MHEDQLSWLKSRNVDLYPQSEKELNYPLTSVESPTGWKGAMPGWGWKLSPPRLRPTGHELWVDNDLIIRERMPAIDSWLKSNKFLISKGYRYKPEYYGNFAHLVPQESYCAGMFGLPPNFDFEQEIYKICNQVLKGEPLGYFDEQGLVAAIVTSHPHLVVQDIETVKSLPSKPLARALHFITTNRYNTHEDWKNFRQSIVM
jgi:hypothetical protein